MQMSVGWSVGLGIVCHFSFQTIWLIQIIYYVIYDADEDDDEEDDEEDDDEEEDDEEDDDEEEDEEGENGEDNDEKIKFFKKSFFSIFLDKNLFFDWSSKNLDVSFLTALELQGCRQSVFNTLKVQF